MSYKSLDIEWDETYKKMKGLRPELYDDVLCCNPEVHAGQVDNIVNRDGSMFYMVVLEDGSVDEFAEEDVLKRNAA